MQFSPKTEAQIISESMIPMGEYPFQVLSATPKSSKAGNPMIVVELDVFLPDGNTRRIKDYLMESMAFKLRHFCVAVGLEKQYDAGSLEPVDIVSRGGVCKIIVKPPKGEYGPQNEVKDYLKGEAKTGAKVETFGQMSVAQRQVPASVPEDQIPF